MRVLIVDDTKSIHTFVKLLLQGRPDVTAVSVYNGAEALCALEDSDKFDLILLDWEMPVLNGPETLRRLSLMENRVPIVMMTTKNDPEDIALAISLGAQEYLMKPFTQDILLEKISAVFDGAGRYVA